MAENCDRTNFGCQWKPHLLSAADLIDSLAAENARLRQELLLNDAAYKSLHDLYDTDIAALSNNNTELRAERDKAVEVVRCKDCRWRDKPLCRAAKSVKYDLRREKHIYKTLMEPDGFCSIGERGTEGKA